MTWTDWSQTISFSPWAHCFPPVTSAIQKQLQIPVKQCSDPIPQAIFTLLFFSLEGGKKKYLKTCHSALFPSVCWWRCEPRSPFYWRKGESKNGRKGDMKTWWKKAWRKIWGSGIKLRNGKKWAKTLLIQCNWNVLNSEDFSSLHLSLWVSQEASLSQHLIWANFTWN